MFPLTSTTTSVILEFMVSAYIVQECIYCFYVWIYCPRCIILFLFLIYFKECCFDFAYNLDILQVFHSFWKSWLFFTSYFSLLIPVDLILTTVTQIQVEMFKLSFSCYCSQNYLQWFNPSTIRTLDANRLITKGLWGKINIVRLHFIESQKGAETHFLFEG